MKTNDVVKCLQSSESNFLEKNREYILVDQNTFGNWRIRQNSAPFQLSNHWYKPERFALSVATALTISLSKKYKTRDGCDVKLYTVNSPDEKYPIVGAILEEGRWSNQTWDPNGYMYAGETSYSDLIEVIEEVKINLSREDKQAIIYRNGSVKLLEHEFPSAFLTKEEFDSIVSARQKLIKQ